MLHDRGALFLGVLVFSPGGEPLPDPAETLGVRRRAAGGGA
jgi:hypothetical protein